jgi:hypothetical protein
MDYEAYKRRASNRAVAIPGYEPYALSPLIKWPLLVRSDGNAVAPVAGDILHRGWRGFERDSLEAIEAVEPLARGVFFGALGRAYEEYIGHSLSAAPGSGDVKHGSEMLPRKTKKCDWVCISERECVLVEVKAVKFAFEASMTKTRESLKAELSKAGGLADGVVQLNESARAIRDGKTPIPKRSYLSGLLVVRGDQVGLNSPMIRGLLDEIVVERGYPPPIIKYQLTNDVGFTYLARLLHQGNRLGSFLQRKMKHAVFQHDDMHFAVLRESETLPPHPLADKHQEQLDDLFVQYMPGLLDAKV